MRDDDAQQSKCRTRYDWEWERQHAGQLEWQEGDHAASDHAPPHGSDAAAHANRPSVPAEALTEHQMPQYREPASRGYRTMSGVDRYKGRSPSGPRNDSGCGRSINGSESPLYQHARQQHSSSTQASIGWGGQVPAWEGRGYGWPDQQLGRLPGSGLGQNGPW